MSGGIKDRCVVKAEESHLAVGRFLCLRSKMRNNLFSAGRSLDQRSRHTNNYRYNSFGVDK